MAEEKEAVSAKCFACCLVQTINDAGGPVSSDMAFVMGIAHSVERGIIETTRSLCHIHSVALRTFAEDYAKIRRRASEPA